MRHLLRWVDSENGEGLLYVENDFFDSKVILKDGTEFQFFDHEEYVAFAFITKHLGVNLNCWSGCRAV